MNKKKWLLTILIPTFLLTAYFTPLVSGLGDSSLFSDSWPMFRHDSSHSGYTNNSDSTDSAKLLWKYKTFGMITASPIITNDLVFFGSRDWDIYCLNSSNGKLVWIYSTTGEIHSSCAVYNNSVFVGSDDGYLYCLDKTTGTLFWKSIIGGKIRSSPVILDNQIFVGSGDHDVFCINSLTGNRIWSYSTLMGIQSSLALSNGIIYFSSDDYFVYALNSTTGDEIWRTHTGSVISSPSIQKNRLYIGSADGYVYCLNSSTGTKIWEYKTQDSVSSSPALAYGSVYVGCEDNNLYCLNASNGKKIWQSQTGFWVYSSPAVSGKNVYVGSQDNRLYCFDAFTGESKWSYATENYVDSSPAVVNGNVFVGSSDYNMYAFSLTSSSIESLPQETSFSISLTTIVFDAFFLTILIFIAFIIIRFIQSRLKNRKTEIKKIENQNQSWFSKHIQILYILAILSFSTLLFINLGNSPLWVSDEKTYSQWAFHMFKEGDYLTPWAYGKVYLWIGKPPLFIWLISVAYQLLGVNNLASRIWSPIFGTLSLIMVFYLGKKLYNLHVGFISAAVLGLFSSFYIFARLAMIDIPFIFFMVSSLYFVVLAEKEEYNKYAVLGGLFFGLAFLTKQITAVLIPLIIFSYFLIAGKGILFFFKKQFVNFWKTAILLVSPWVVYMILRFGPEFWENYFIYSGFIRATSPIEGHIGNYLYYFESIVRTENLFLVILLAVSVGFCAYNSVIKKSKEDRLILVWIFIVFLVFTLAQTKLEWYILPAFPAFAIAISSFLYKLINKIRSFRI